MLQTHSRGGVGVQLSHASLRAEVTAPHAFFFIFFIFFVVLIFSAVVAGLLLPHCGAKTQPSLPHPYKRARAHDRFPPSSTETLPSRLLGGDLASPRHCWQHRQNSNLHTSHACCVLGRPYHSCMAVSSPLPPPPPPHTPHHPPSWSSSSFPPPPATDLEERGASTPPPLLLLGLLMLQRWGRKE